MSSDTATFFNKNVNFYSKLSPQYFDYYFLNSIKTLQDQNLNLLDIGGGSGTFVKLIANHCPNISLTVLDPSEKMLSQIDDTRINTVKGKIPDQVDQVLLDSKFHLIHVKEVFHHVTGSSIRSSKELLRESLCTIKEYLTDDGLVLIHELFYESYLIPTLSRNLIFYSLALQSKLRIKIPARQFLMDLRVCFYTRSEFRSMLGECGFEIVDYYEANWANDINKKILFLKNWGVMLFIVKKLS